MAEVTLSTLVNLDNIKMKWRETYVSEGLNRKVVPSSPAGIYQGLRLIENIASPRQVEITSDVDTGYHMAVFQSTTGFSLTYWDIIGTAIILDLSDVNLDNQETIIAMEMDYQVGVDTTADWKAFPIADFDALPAARKSDLIILGTVNVPGAATNITSSMITFERTTMAWRNLSKGAISWSPLLRNGDFEQAEDGASNAWFWELATIPAGGTGTTEVTTSDPFRNTRALTLSSLTSGSVIYAAIQNVAMPVTPGQLGMIKLQKKNLVVPTGSLVVSLHFFDATGASTTALDIPIDVTGVDGSYEELVAVFEVPASRTMLGQIIIGGGLDDAGAPQTLIHIDDFQVWLETSGERNDLQHLMGGDIEVMGTLAMREPTSPYSDPSFKQRYDSGLNQVSMDDHASSGALAVDINGSLDVGAEVAVGADLIGTVANADLARVIAPASVFAGVEYTLMWESIPAGSQGYRQYVSSTGAIVETVNAKWDNTANLWTHDQTGSDAMKTTKSIAGTLIQRRTTTAGTWNDSSWDANYVEHLQSTGAVQINAATTPGLDVNHTGANDAISVDHSGTGAGEGVSVAMSGAAGTGSGVRIGRTGTQAGILLELDNSNNETNHCVRITNTSTSTSSDSVEINHSGLGTGIDLNCTNTSLALAGIDLDYDGTGDALNIDVGGTSTIAQGLVVNDSTAVVRTNPTFHVTKTNAANFGPLFKTEGIGGSASYIYASGAHEVLIDGGPNASFVINAPDAAALANADALLVLASNTSDAVDYENIECISSGGDINSRHEANGDWHTDTGLYTTGAGDYAECMDTETAASNYEEGDLMVISSAGKVDKSSTANSTAIIGVYSTNPSVLGNNPISDLLMDQGTLEANSWAWAKGSYPNGNTWNHIEIDGDQTANYAVDTRCRMDAPYNNKGFKVVSVSYDGGEDKTSVYFNQTYPNMPLNTEVYYAVPTRDCIPVGMLGLVPTKCITENGTINPGDLLVSSSTAGHAMKASSPGVGTVIGRALETLTDTGAQNDMALIDCMVSI